VGAKLRSVGPPSGARISYDVSRLTLLPGLIDTHVHIANHFGRNGRATSEGEGPEESILYEAESAYSMLLNGFTTAQSIGSRLDVPLRAAISRGVLPGPRLLTSIAPINETTGTPDQIMGTDAGAGAHGQNAREIVYRVQTGGQSAMEAITGATSLAAEALGLKETIGAIAPGFEGDLIGVDGDPLTDITALRRVVFAMKGGKEHEFRVERPRSHESTGRRLCQSVACS